MPLLLEFVPFVTLLGIIFLATSYLYRTTGREEHVARPTRMPIPSPARSSVHNPILSSVYNPIRSPSQRSVNSSVYEGDSMDQTNSGLEAGSEAGYDHENSSSDTLVKLHEEWTDNFNVILGVLNATNSQLQQLADKVPFPPPDLRKAGLSLTRFAMSKHIKDLKKVLSDGVPFIPNADDFAFVHQTLDYLFDRIEDGMNKCDVKNSEEYRMLKAVTDSHRDIYDHLGRFVRNSSIMCQYLRQFDEVRAHVDEIENFNAEMCNLQEKIRFLR